MHADMYMYVGTYLPMYRMYVCMYAYSNIPKISTSVDGIGQNLEYSFVSAMCT